MPTTGLHIALGTPREKKGGAKRMHLVAAQKEGDEHLYDPLFNIKEKRTRREDLLR